MQAEGQGEEGSDGVLQRPRLKFLASEAELAVLVQQAGFETKLEALQAQEVHTSFSCSGQMKWALSCLALCEQMLHQMSEDVCGMNLSPELHWGLLPQEYVDVVVQHCGPCFAGPLGARLC